MRKIILALALLAASWSPALSQGVPNSATVVTTCGTTPSTYTPGQNKALLQNTAGQGCIAPTSGTVTGTVTANQGTAGANSWPVNIDQTTQGTTNGVVINASAIPTGAATSALQSNVQSAAGTPDATAITIQGNSSGVAVPVSGTVTITPSGSQTVVQPTAANLNIQNVNIASATVGVSTQSCTVACASTIVSGAHALYGISGSATVAGTILVYDATSCPANGTVTPKKAYAYTVANSPIGISWGSLPLINTTGIAVCFSTTGPFTATASTTAYLTVDYK